jgi:hypothetical protein
MKVMQMVDKRFLILMYQVWERRIGKDKVFDAGVPIINHDLSISGGSDKVTYCKWISFGSRRYYWW